jgi:hypothetical protein
MVKTFEAQHRPGPAFDAAMILFDHVIEVLPDQRQLVLPADDN